MKTKKHFFLIVTFVISFVSYSNAQNFICFQAEDLNIPAGGKWAKATKHADFGGTGYIEWLGGGRLGTEPTAAEIIEVDFNITKDGIYTIYFRGRRDRGLCGCPIDAKEDECNDIKTKVDNGSYVKTMIKGDWSTWFWNNKYELNAPSVSQTKYTLTAGKHKLYIAGRSQGVQLDGLVIKLFTTIIEMPVGQVNCKLSSVDEIVSDEIMIYPNPCSDIINVKNCSNQSSVKLYSILGTEMPINPIKGSSNNLSFSTTLLTPGIYFIIKDGRSYKFAKE